MGIYFTGVKFLKSYYSNVWKNDTLYLFILLYLTLIKVEIVKIILNYIENDKI